jgi:acyl carrier protein
LKLENVDDVYPLSPMQETMLFHASTRVANLNDRQNFTSARDVLFNQVQLNIFGDLVVGRFENAWQAVVDRYPAMRSAFIFKGLTRPQQIVRTKVKLPFNFIDLTKLDSPGQQTAITSLKITDRQQGFDFERAPLMRVTLVKLASAHHQLIWSSHHLIVDRWCIPILFQDLLRFYQHTDSQNNEQSKPVVPFKRYIAWLKQQSRDACARFWSTNLHGFTKSSLLSTRAVGIDSQQQQAFELTLPDRVMADLKKLCNAHTLTLATLIQGAWALLLNRHTQLTDVAFGLVVSGRPHSIANVESIVGSFVNNVPARVKLDPQQNILSWLKGLQRSGIKRAAYEYVALSELHQYTGLADEQPIFDSVLLWLAPSQPSYPADIRLETVSADMNTAFPLTLSIEEKATSLRFFLKLAAGQALHVDGATLLDDLRDLLSQLAAVDTQTSMAEFNIVGEEAMHGEAVEKVVILQGQGQTDKKGRERVKLEPLQDYLIQQWQTILEVEQVSLDDDFFALGGNSLKAAQLLRKVELAERMKIPILALFQGRTVRDMARIILDKDWPVRGEIATALRSTGNQKPLFCIASPEVNTVGYANLSQYLDKNIPFYVLQSPPTQDLVAEPRASELPALAKAYIDAMVKVQPAGSYRLLGMCAGAQIAIEMARQLEERKQPLAYLGIINTWAFYTVSKWYYLEKVLDLARYYRARISHIARSKLISARLTGSSGAHSQPEKVATAHPNGTELEPPYSLIDDVGWVNRKQQLKKIAQVLTVYRIVKQPFWRIRDAALGWGNQAHRTVVESLPGKFHLKILREPVIQIFAKRLEQNLRVAEQQQNPENTSNSTTPKNKQTQHRESIVCAKP